MRAERKQRELLKVVRDAALYKCPTTGKIQIEGRYDTRARLKLTGTPNNPIPYLREFDKRKLVKMYKKPA